MIIGITGHARHGKDTVADFICDLTAPDFYKCALADTMKVVASIVFGWDFDDLYTDKKDEVDPKWGISPRHVLQSLGTEWGQYKLSEYDSFREKTGRLLWTRSLLNTIGDDDNAVIADVRFPHEADAIKKRGGKIVMIRRPGWPVDMTHDSEKAIEEIKPDYVIRNGLCLDALKDETKKMLNYFSITP